MQLKKSEITIYVDESEKIRENIMCVKKIMFGICTRTCTCKNGKYFEIIIGDLVNMRDGIIEVAKTVPTKTVPTKTIAIKSFYILLAFLLITVSLLIIVSIY